MRQATQNWIPLEECRFGLVYAVLARGFGWAVFDGSVFIGIRYKFGYSFLDEENHWDAKDFPTCKPMFEVCKVPIEIEVSPRVQFPDGNIEPNDALFNFLRKVEENYGRSTEYIQKRIAEKVPNKS